MCVKEPDLYYYCPHCGYEKVIYHKDLQDACVIIPSDRYFPPMSFKRCPECDFVGAAGIPLTATYFMAPNDFKFLAKDRIKAVQKYLKKQKNLVIGIEK